jgi:hypothetical protein
VTEKEYLPQYTAELLCDLKAYSQAAGVVKNAYVAEKLKGLISSIRDAVHIVLPPNGEIYRDFHKIATKEELASTYVLPAPITTFEFPIEKGFYNDESSVLAGDFVDASRTETTKGTPIANVVLVFDYKQFDGDASQYTVLNNKDEECPPLCIHGFWKWPKKLGFSWVPSEHVMICPTPIELLQVGNNDEWHMTSTIVNFFQETKITPEEGVIGNQIAGSYSGCVDALIQACHSLRVGATLEACREKSYTRNRTFEKKGAGGFEYHVLKLPHGTVKETLGSRCGGSGADRDGPRYHFRRAHLRNLSTGTQTFVRSCFVGNRDKGVIEKEYKLDKGVAA